MQLEYSGTIPVPVGDAWAAISDLERVAGCVPGVRLDQVSGDEVAGTVTIPLGPLRLTYRGEAAFVERDEAAGRVVIDAAGRDSHGEQAASARITAQLRGDGQVTHVTAVADVSVRGMSAPIGFAVGEFGTGLLRQFVTRLGAAPAHAAAPAAATAGAGGPASSSPSGGSSPEPSSAPGPVTSRDYRTDTPVFPVPPPRKDDPALLDFAPIAGALAAGVIIGWLLGRRGRRS